MSAGRAVVVAADSTRARVFLAEGDDMQELADLHNPQNRMHERDLVSDAAGRRYGETMSAGFSTYGGDSMKEHRAEEFAARICKAATRALQERRAPRLYLVAEPQMLGLLRQRMDDSVRQCVGGEVPKSLSMQDASVIRAQLPDQL